MTYNISYLIKIDNPYRDLKVFFPTQILRLIGIFRKLSTCELCLSQPVKFKD